ncbi:MAG: polymorphic toxin-type HINT domain-containing protein [Bacteroidia bacterium]
MFEPAGSYTWLQIDAWLTTCNAAEPDIANLTTLPEPIKCAAATEPENDFVTQAGLDCEEESNEIAANQANTMYDYMLNLAANTYINSYRASCLDLAGKEAFTVTYDLQEYYYTLYYYDQAATLIKTVPPEGVHPIYSSAALTAVQNHRVDPATYPSPTYPPHTMETNNKFNSFQQCVEGTTPDGGTTKVWYDEQGRIIATQNAKQYAYTPPGYSYVLYDALGRPYEAGETYSATTLTYEISRNQNTSAPYNFNDWVTSAIAAGATQVVHTYYDEQIPGSSTSTYIPGGQKNLRNRISSVTYEEVRNISDLSNTYGREYNLPTLFDNATHYSYDIHGNALVVMQQNTDLNLTLIGQSKKRIDYEYDVASGKVNAVHYQQNISSTLPTPDEFHHKYVYDANNRVVSAYTSRDGYIWDTDARYFYYAHGPVSRVEIGDKTVQGEDFAYTIGGWLKGVNSDTRDAERDMGKDGSSSSTGLNYSFGRDAFGYSLSYYNGDYLSVTTQTLAGNFLASQTNVTNNFHTGFYELFNGNIAAMTTAITNANEASLDVQGRDFRYDQLNRIKQVNAYKDATNLVANNYWGTGTADNGDYYEDFSYDMNGNIMNVRRNGNLTTTHQQMDLLTYNYTANTNRLDIVIDATSCVASDYGNDIDGSAGTYVYDAIGNLTEDPSEQIDNIEWTVSGKLKQVTRIATSTKADLEFVYDAMGNRIAKIVKPRPGGNASAQELWTYTYYVRDGSGNVLAVYDRSFVDKSGGAYEDHFNLKEWDIYGSGRLGVKHPDDGSSNIIRNFTATHSGLLFDILSMSYSSPGPVFSPVNGCLLTRKLGKKEYEEANHLGNVLESVSDMKYAVGTTSSVDYYIPDVISYSDYYAFGAPQPGRTGGDPYRYKFNGMETDPESKNGEGLDYTTEYRAYDARVGRWFSPDPIVKPWESPYAAFANNPVYYIDPSGLDPGDGTGKVAGGGASKAGKSSSLENVHADPRAGTVIIFGPADFKIPPPVVNGPVKLDIPNTGDPDVGPGKNGPISTRESGPLSTNTDVGVSQTAQTLSQETTAINGGAVWGGLTYIKASNLRTLYSAESKQRFTENTFENRFGRFELKARIREQTPQPIKNALDRTNPMTEEWMKVSTRNNPGKSNPQYNNGAKYFGIVGKVVTAYGIYLSVQNVYYAPQPAKQIVIEGGFWTGAYYGGVIGATYGIEFGPWGGLVGGLAMGTIGGICGRATAEAIVNAPNPYSEYLSEHPLDRDHPENLIYHICFAKGTLVYSKSGLVPIESIQIGDSVFTYDSLANRIELGQVTNILSHQANEIYSLQTTNQRILATADHPFYVEGKGWTSVNKLQVGDKLRTNINGNFEEIKNLQLTSQSVSVYNIEVDKNHNYFVTNNKILVHNKYISPSVIQKLKQENLKTKRPNPQ